MSESGFVAWVTMNKAKIKDKETLAEMIDPSLNVDTTQPQTLVDLINGWFPLHFPKGASSKITSEKNSRAWQGLGNGSNSAFSSALPSFKTRKGWITKADLSFASSRIDWTQQISLHFPSLFRQKGRWQPPVSLRLAWVESDYHKEWGLSTQYGRSLWHGAGKQIFHQTWSALWVQLIRSESARGRHS